MKADLAVFRKADVSIRSGVSALYLDSEEETASQTPDSSERRGLGFVFSDIFPCDIDPKVHICSGDA